MGEAKTHTCVNKNEVLITNKNNYETACKEKYKKEKTHCQKGREDESYETSIKKEESIIIRQY
jgi:hypothetical protein